MNVYEIFRIILGLVASFLVLFFLVQYAGVYSGMQENTHCLMILDNFLKAADDVYLTGNGISFDQFEQSRCSYVFRGDDPAQMWSEAGQVSVRTPMIYIPGDKLVLEKKKIDYGWWDFGFVEALPEMTIIFNPLDTSQESKNLMKSIVGIFPDTTGRTPKIQFGFCDGDAINRPCNSGTSFCEGFAMIIQIDNLGSPLNQCALKTSPNQRLVTLHPNCTSGMASQGICITPPISGFGFARTALSDRLHIHKNALDLVALIAGGDGRNVYGPVADNLYAYENSVFRKDLEMISSVMFQGSSLISNNLPAQPQGYDENAKCKNAFLELSLALQAIQVTVSDEKYYENPVMVTNFINDLNDADDAYQKLLYLGCVYQVE